MKLCARAHVWPNSDWKLWNWAGLDVRWGFPSITWGLNLWEISDLRKEPTQRKYLLKNTPIRGHLVISEHKRGFLQFMRTYLKKTGEKKSTRAVSLKHDFVGHTRSKWLRTWTNRVAQDLSSILLRWADQKVGHVRPLIYFVILIWNDHDLGSFWFLANSLQFRCYFFPLDCH